MDVILAARNAVQAPVEAPYAPGNPQRQEPTQRYTIDLLGVNGDVIRLTGGRGGLHVSDDPAPSGFWMGGYNSQTEPTPGVDGARYGSITASSRSVGLTVNYDFETVAERRAFANRFVQALNPKRGLAGFLVTEPDTTARMVRGRFVGSQEQWKVYRERGTWSIELDVADDPYWLDAPGSELPEQTWRAPEPVEYYPYLPTGLSENGAIGEPIPINNDGHEDIYPDHLLRGPATGALIINDTTGESLSWHGQLAEGKWLLFVTKPGMQEVVDSDGVPRFHELDQDPEPAFWHLEPGLNVIRTVLEGVGSGTSVTMLELARRWLIQG